jgi:hypothetical protein
LRLKDKNLDIGALENLSIGVIALIVVYLITKETIQAFAKRRETPVVSELAMRLKVIDERVSDLHDWHSREDDEGVKIWYVRRSLENAIKELSGNIAVQTKVMETILTETRSNRRAINRYHAETEG